MLRSWDALPSATLQPTGPASRQILSLGISDLQQVGRYLQSLPYGRTSRPDALAVLNEGKGTCSTKHALLAVIAQEQGIPLDLTLGVYDMSEANTPGVGTVLSKYGLRSIAEAHCYVTFEESRVDVTRPLLATAKPITRFMHEQTIRPDQIGEYKVIIHHSVLREWALAHPIVSRHYDLAALWKIREECIAALEQFSANVHNSSGN